MKVVIYRKGKKCMLQDLPAWLLVELNKEINQLRNEKKPRHKGPPRYAGLSRAFTPEELKRFMASCNNEKLHVLFALQALLGLRVGEVVNVKESDILDGYKFLRVHTEKANTTDFLPLSKVTGQMLFEWIQENKASIERSGGYIFFSKNPVLTRRLPHISSNCVRNEFRRIAEASGLNMSYGTTRGNPRVPYKKLYRLTTHSLRHYFATQVYAMTKDLRQTQKLMRHRDIKSTTIYTNIGMDEMARTLEKLSIS